LKVFFFSSGFFYYVGGGWTTGLTGPTGPLFPNGFVLFGGFCTGLVLAPNQSISFLAVVFVFVWGGKTIGPVFLMGSWVGCTTGFCWGIFIVVLGVFAGYVVFFCPKKLAKSIDGWFVCCGGGKFTVLFTVVWLFWVEGELITGLFWLIFVVWEGGFVTGLVLEDGCEGGCLGSGFLSLVFLAVKA